MHVSGPEQPDDDGTVESSQAADPAPEPPSSAPPDGPEPEWKRRRRLARVFGDVLPESTGDDRDESNGSGYSERWWREQMPPHHGQK